MRGGNKTSQGLVKSSLAVKVAALTTATLTTTTLTTAAHAMLTSKNAAGGTAWSHALDGGASNWPLWLTYVPPGSSSRR